MKKIKTILGAIVLTLALTGQSCSTQVKTETPAAQPAQVEPSAEVTPSGATQIKPADGQDAGADFTPQPVAPIEEPIPVVPKVKIEPVTINMTAERFTFAPSTITVKEGQTVTVNVTVKDATHGFRLADFGVNLTIPAGETQSVTFVADKKGAFKFACSVYCGSGHADMTGTLIVE